MKNERFLCFCGTWLLSCLSAKSSTVKEGEMHFSEDPWREWPPKWCKWCSNVDLWMEGGGMGGHMGQSHVRSSFKIQMKVRICSEISPTLKQYGIFKLMGCVELWYIYCDFYNCLVKPLFQIHIVPTSWTTKHSDHGWELLIHFQSQYAQTHNKTIS